MSIAPDPLILMSLPLIVIDPSFFIAIDAADAKFDRAATEKLLTDAAATRVLPLEE